MLSKLAVRNAKRSVKDYVIYLITVTLAFSFIFAFNILSFSKEVFNLSSVMENFKYVMYFVNAIVSFVVCFLINYTIKFMFGKRSKEFGTYMVLGIKKNKVSNLFTLENIILGLVSFLLSIPLGYLFSQIMCLVITNLFDLNSIVNVGFSFKAVILSLVYFVVVFILVLFLARRRIKKMKVYDLLYYEKTNEKSLLRYKKLKMFTFILSVVLGIVALILFDREFSVVGTEPSMAIIFISVLLIILSIYGVTMTMSLFFLNFVISHKSIKYKGNNLFVTRTFFSKVRTMSFTLGTLTVFITLTLIALNISSLFKGMFDYQLNINAPYDISISSDEDKISKYLSFIKEEHTIEEQHIYDSYVDGNAVISVIDKHEGESGWRETDHYMRLSDYNKALEMRGMKPVSLKDDEYILHITKEYRDYLENEKSIETINLSNGVTLHQKKVISENYSYAWGDGYGFLLIVPDYAVKDLRVINTHLIVNTKEKTTEEFGKKITGLIETDMCKENEDGVYICYSLAGMKIRGVEEAQNNGFMTITSFVCFYIAFIFTAVVGTVLAIQSLADSTKFKYRYKVLSKLGVRDEELYKTIRKQILMFFLYPLVYPIIVSYFSLASMNKIFKIALSTDNVYLIFYFVNLGVFLVIYFVYLLATYFGFKKNISE